MIEIKHRITGAVLVTVDADTLCWANLTEANLTEANLTEADLTGANLTGANLYEARMPGFPDRPLPESLAEAAAQTREWLAGGHWLKAAWIKTPQSAYAGDCLACLHGAAVYVGGPTWGPKLSQTLTERGYTVAWNDAPERTLPEVLAALEEVAEAAK
jgi:hypothetical protein